MRAFRRAISSAFSSGVYGPGWSLAHNSPRFTRASLFLYVASCFCCEEVNSTIGGAYPCQRVGLCHVRSRKVGDGPPRSRGCHPPPRWLGRRGVGGTIWLGLVKPNI